MEFKHISVLLNECIDALNIDPDGLYADATTGGGGHSFEIASRLKNGHLYCFDKDTEALKAASERLKPFEERITFIHSDFRNMREELNARGVEKLDGILFDLGVSSYQLDEKERGFSYHEDAPLDMRMDQTTGITAADVLATYSQDELKRIFYQYGEERYSGLIASAIVRKRETAPIKTTLELADLIVSALPGKALKEKQHPARRVFQALRIEVNGELSGLNEALDQAIDLLNEKGRIAVISFHSLEDRIVKDKMKSWATGCICPPDFPVCVCGRKERAKVLTRHPILPNENELETNGRSHSAKLRVAERI